MSNKAFNFDKWFNIWLVIILGLHTISLIVILIILYTAESLTVATITDPVSQALIGGAIYTKPIVLIAMIGMHVVSAAISVGITYFVLRRLAKDSR